jgi:hypothetical protein
MSPFNECHSHLNKLQNQIKKAHLKLDNGRLLLRECLCGMGLNYTNMMVILDEILKDVDNELKELL